MPPPLDLPPFPFIINIFHFLLFFLIPIHVTSDAESYKSCAPFSCGKFTNISYPFWSINKQPSFCGHPNFNLACQHGNLTIEIKSQKFHIIDINQTSQLLRIARLDLWSINDDATINASCPKINESLDLNFFKYTSIDESYILLYECDHLPNSYSYTSSLTPEVYQVISCLIEGKPHDAYLVLSNEVTNFNYLKCKNNVTLHGLRSSFTKESNIVGNVLEEGFEVEWSGMEEDISCNYCMKSGGRCGYNTSKHAFMCLCPSKQSYGNCGFCRPSTSTYEIWSDELHCKLGSTPTYVSGMYNLPSLNVLLDSFVD
ncbi:unnamed protein product [Trifolium pratense]|uniref:Uncharacterized protein n=1 Tax=Trifolium pratense TaxID=57577 RepID=A0ACB0KGN7_TRIPR|nr:unnamed protein product [Trifolium pratense]